MIFINPILIIFSVLLVQTMLYKLINYVSQKDKKNILIFCILLILANCIQPFIQTLWYFKFIECFYLILSIIFIVATLFFYKISFRK